MIGWVLRIAWGGSARRQNRALVRGRFSFAQSPHLTLPKGNAFGPVRYSILPRDINGSYDYCRHQRPWMTTNEPMLPTSSEVVISCSADDLMRVLITGGRDFADQDMLSRALDRLHREHCFTLLIHGDARGTAPRKSGSLLDRLPYFRVQESRRLMIRCLLVCLSLPKHRRVQGKGRIGSGGCVAIL